MILYKFTYGHGKSVIGKELEAKNYTDFAENKLPAWERETGFKCIPGSVKLSRTQTFSVPEPAK